MQKNQPNQFIGVELISKSTGEPFTGEANVFVTGDNGVQAPGETNGGVTDHKGNGYHSYTPSQDESNYDHIAFTFVHDDIVPVTLQVETTENLVEYITEEISDGVFTSEQIAQIEAIYGKLMSMGTIGVKLFGPRRDGDEVVIISGYSYTVASGTAPTFRSDQWGDLTGWSIFAVKSDSDHTVVCSGQVVVGGAGITQVIAINFTSAVTEGLEPGTSQLLRIVATKTGEDSRHIANMILTVED